MRPTVPRSHDDANVSLTSYKFRLFDSDRDGRVNASAGTRVRYLYATVTRTSRIIVIMFRDFIPCDTLSGAFRFFLSVFTRFFDQEFCYYSRWNCGGCFSSSLVGVFLNNDFYYIKFNCFGFCNSVKNNRRRLEFLLSISSFF